MAEKDQKGADKSKKGKVEIQRGFVLGYIALGVVVMATGVIMSFSEGAQVKASAESWNPLRQLVTLLFGASTPPAPGEVRITFSEAISPTSTRLTNKDVIVESGGTLRMAGQHNLNSLTIKNGGVITHDPLRPDIDIADDRVSLTASGSDKKVDLVVAGKITIEPGGRIDVSGKGFPTSDPAQIQNRNFCKGEVPCGKGFGPGGGSNIVGLAPSLYLSAAAGGHAGRGAYGASGDNLYWGYSQGGYVYGSALLPGSAGGSVRVNNINGGLVYSAKGGAGGGVVRVKAQELVAGEGAILANGANAQCYSDYQNNVCGGAGAGGLVNIELAPRVLRLTPLMADVSAGHPLWINKNVEEYHRETAGALNTRGRITVEEGGMIQAKGGFIFEEGYQPPRRSYGAPGGGGYVAVVASTSAMSCSEVDPSRVTRDAWTQNWCLVNESDSRRFTNDALLENYQCTASWCGDNITPFYRGNWGEGSLFPIGDASIADHIGFKSARKINFSPGKYVFKFDVDEQAEAYLRDSATPFLSATVADGEKESEPIDLTGEQLIRVNYREATGAAKLYFSWEKVGELDGPPDEDTSTLSVSLTANPQSITIGQASSLTATIGGTATGGIAYNEHGCGSGGEGMVSDTDGGSFTCTYSTAGEKIASITVTREGVTRTATATITVTAATTPPVDEETPTPTPTPTPIPPVDDASPTPTPTPAAPVDGELSVSLTAIPSSGPAPLNDVALKADFSGLSSGTNATLFFHCNRSDDTTEISPYRKSYTVAPSQTTLTTDWHCGTSESSVYATPGEVTAKVVLRQLVDRQDRRAQATTTITVLPQDTTPTPEPTPDHSIVLRGGYNAINIPSSWGDVRIGFDRFAGSLTIFDFNWFGDENWRPTNNRGKVTEMIPGLGYYIYSPAETTLGVYSVNTGKVPVIKQGWNLLSNSTGEALNVASASFRVIKPDQTNKDCNETGCSETKTLKQLISAGRGYSVIYELVNPYTANPDEVWRTHEIRPDTADEVEIPANRNFWFYLDRETRWTTWE